MSCSTARRASTRRTCGTRRRPPRRATTWRAAACARRSCASSGSGYAPSAWDRVLVGAQRDGFGAAGAGGGRAGPARPRERRPVRPLPRPDHVPAGGRARAGARLRRAGDGEGRGPKYLNTSENEIYHKGRQLFGIDLARAHAAKSGRIVVVEGYTDVLALHQAGIRESVAIMGTALTAEQMAELGRAATLVVLALDADRSGQEAMLRAARVARTAASSCGPSRCRRGPTRPNPRCGRVRRRLRSGWTARSQ